jgi:hypothetical protein
MERRLQSHAGVSTEQAIEAGNFDSEGVGSFTDPMIERSQGLPEESFRGATWPWAGRVHRPVFQLLTL